MRVSAGESRSLVLGATGRIGQLLRLRWGAECCALAASRPNSGRGARVDWLVFDPLNAAGSAAGGQWAVPISSVWPGPFRGAAQVRIWRITAVWPRRPCAQARLWGRMCSLASSAAVYGAQPKAREDQPLTPANPYGIAKAEMEAHALDLGARLGVRVCNLRIGNIAGFDAALGGWRPGFTLDRFQDGTTPMRSYIGLSCLADVLGALLQQDDLPNSAQYCPARSD